MLRPAPASFVASDPMAISTICATPQTQTTNLWSYCMPPPFKMSSFDRTLLSTFDRTQNSGFENYPVEKELFISLFCSLVSVKMTSI